MAITSPVKTKTLATPLQIQDMSDLALPADTVGLILDEGYGGTGYGLDAGDRIAVQFTPGEYPFKLLAAGYAAIDWGDRQNDWNAPCYLIIYGEDAGRPGSEIAGYEVQAVDSSVVNLFDLSGENIVINSGSFFCAIENITEIDPSVMIDIKPPVHRAGWFYDDLHDGSGLQWYSFGELLSPDYPGISLADTLDPIIRAVGVEGSGIVELKPDVITVTPMATVIASKNTINYTLAESCNVELTLWDAVGCKVKTIYSGHVDAGEHQLTWDSTGLPRGTYFVYLKALNTVTSAKVVLLE